MLWNLTLFSRIEDLFFLVKLGNTILRQTCTSEPTNFATKRSGLLRFRRLLETPLPPHVEASIVALETRLIRSRIRKENEVLDSMSLWYQAAATVVESLGNYEVLGVSPKLKLSQVSDRDYYAVEMGKGGSSEEERLKAFRTPESPMEPP